MSTYRKIIAAFVVILFFAACASFDGRGLKPGVATEADVRNLMGTPAAVWTTQDGGSQLAYPRGPMGLQTFMVQIDHNGRLVSIEQVLDEKHFARLKVGASQEAVSQLFGPPFQTIPFAWRKELAWDYRYRDLWGYVSIFSVIFGDDGKVKTSVTVREDPMFFPAF